MLRTIESVAIVLYRWRALVWVTGLVAGLIVIRGLIWSGDSEGPILAALLGGLWAGFLLAFSYTFARKPPEVELNEGFWQRFKAKTLRNSYLVLVAMFAIVALMLCWLTLRAFSL